MRKTNSVIMKTAYKQKQTNYAVEVHSDKDLGACWWCNPEHLDAYTV